MQYRKAVVITWQYLITNIRKKIEILIYALDEVLEEKATDSKKTMANFWGTISDATAAELHKNVEESRNSWEERLNKQF